MPRTHTMNLVRNRKSVVPFVSFTNPAFKSVGLVKPSAARVTVPTKPRQPKATPATLHPIPQGTRPMCHMRDTNIRLTVNREISTFYCMPLDRLRKLPARVRGVYVIIALDSNRALGFARQSSYRAVYVGKSSTDVRRRVHHHRATKLRYLDPDHLAVVVYPCDSPSDALLKQVEMEVYTECGAWLNLNGLGTGSDSQSLREQKPAAAVAAAVRTTLGKGRALSFAAGSSETTFAALVAGLPALYKHVDRCDNLAHSIGAVPSGEHVLRKAYAQVLVDVALLRADLQAKLPTQAAVDAVLEPLEQRLLCRDLYAVYAHCQLGKGASPGSIDSHYASVLGLVTQFAASRDYRSQHGLIEREHKRQTAKRAGQAVQAEPAYEARAPSVKRVKSGGGRSAGAPSGIASRTRNAALAH